MFARDIGTDLRAANVLVFMEGEGIAIHESSTVVVDTHSSTVLTVGT